MQILNITQDRSQNIDLWPVQAHINKYQLKNTCVNQLVYVFVIKEIFVNSAEFIPCKCYNTQVAKLLNYLKILIPWIQHVFI